MRSFDDHVLPVLAHGDKTRVPARDAYGQILVVLGILLRFKEHVFVDRVDLHEESAESGKALDKAYDVGHGVLTVRAGGDKTDIERCARAVSGQIRLAVGADDRRGALTVRSGRGGQIAGQHAPLLSA